MEWNNPKIFREMSMPFDSLESAKQAGEAFLEGVRQLRVQHKMTNVVCIVDFSYLAEDGTEVQAQSSLRLGDQFQHEAMLASLLGMVQAERQEFIGSLLAKGLRKGKVGS